MPAPAPIPVLLMAYGTAPSLDDADIRAYLRHILQFYRKVDPTDAEVAHLKHRLVQAGGSPLYDITERIARAVEAELDSRRPGAFQAYTAMKHSPPFVDEVVAGLPSNAGLAIGVALAPFRSRLSTEGYYRLVTGANALRPAPLSWAFAGDWNLAPEFLELWRRNIETALGSMPEGTQVVFTNHSLPTRISEWDDPYPRRFQETAEALANLLSLTDCTIAYQSAGGGRTPWLGPDLVDVVAALASRKCRSVLAAPIGFLMDHLEVSYDLDIEAQESARQLGVRLARTQMPNDDPLLVATLASVVEGAESHKPGAVSRESGEAIIDQ